MAEQSHSLRPPARQASLASRAKSLAQLRDEEEPLSEPPKIPYHKRRSHSSSRSPSPSAVRRRTDAADDDDVVIISAAQASTINAARSADVDETLTQLKAFKQGSQYQALRIAELQNQLQTAQHQLDYVRQMCAGCGITLVDMPRLISRCCDRPICADCQGHCLLRFSLSFVVNDLPVHQLCCIQVYGPTAA